jgi:hypothetical protein
MRQLMRFGILATWVACSLASAPSGAFATTVATSTAQGARAHAVPLKHSPRLGPHHIFGTILAINGNLLSVQRRNGKFITVDATTVIASDDYSYPLFVGKTVAIDGTFPTKTTFLATHIEAVTTLQSLEVDK